MRTYIIRRLLLMIPSIFIITVIVFGLVRMIPGNAVDQLFAEMASTGKSGLNREDIERMLGLDVPVHVQYGRWITGVLQGDLGTTIRGGSTPITEKIVARLPVTFELGLIAILVGLLISLPIGILSAIRQDSFGDYVARGLAILFISIPSFSMATVVMVYPALWWGWSPPMDYISFTEDPLGNLGLLIIPATILGFVLSGTTMRMMRAMMLEVLRQDYIRTAWSKGFTEKLVVIRHALKNALIPVVTLVGYQVPILVGGAVIIEQIFTLPGIGRLLVDALSQRDYPVVSAVNLVIGTTVLVINLLVDLTWIPGFDTTKERK